MKTKEFDRLKLEFKAYVASVQSAHRAMEIYKKAMLQDRLDPVIKSMGKHADNGPGYAVLPSFISLQRIIGHDPSLDTEGMRRSLEQARLANDKQFFIRLGRSLSDKHKPNGDSLSIFLINSWVEMPFRRKGDPALTGMMVFSGEDIAWLCDHFMPPEVIKKTQKDGRRGEEMTSPRTVAAHIKKLGLIPFQFIRGRIVHGTAEGSKPRLLFSEVS